MNSVVFVRQMHLIKDSKSFLALMNKCSILNIAIGDFLTGFYLICIVTADLYIVTNGNRKEEIRWRTSWTCGALGVISTLGQQISLCSMTMLSVFRIKSVTTWSMQRRITKQRVRHLYSFIISIYILCILISAIPILPFFRETFVNGYYNPDHPFVYGIVTKKEIFEITSIENGKFREHHEKFVRDWSYYEDRITENILEPNKSAIIKAGRYVNFYGSSAVCLFKYFVTDDDPQKNFSIAVLLLNLTFFIIITISSVALYVINKRSTEKTSSNITTDQSKKSQASKNSRLQRKVTLIVLTDFLCWVPFIFLCGLHFSEIVNGDKFYSYFSLFILPINSVINPVLYDDSIVRWIKKCRSKLRQWLGAFIDNNDDDDKNKDPTSPTSSQTSESRDKRKSLIKLHRRWQNSNDTKCLRSKELEKAQAMSVMSANQCVKIHTFDDIIEEHSV